MYYVMLKFLFLYVGLRKTIKDIFKLVGEKKICSGKTRELFRENIISFLKNIDLLVYCKFREFSKKSDLSAKMCSLSYSYS